MTAFFDYEYPDIPKEVYLRTDAEWLGLCDAVLFLPNWEESEGSVAEHHCAFLFFKQIFHSLDEVPDVSPCGSVKVGFPVNSEDYPSSEEE